MEIVAKFKCETILKGVDAETPTLRAVYGKEGEPNGQWSRWTPSGQVEMFISNPSAHGFFRPGVEYIVTFREAGPSDG